MEKGIPHKWKSNESHSCNSCIRQYTLKTVTRDKERYQIFIKGLIEKEDIKIVNIQALNIGVLQYIRQMLTDIKGVNDSNTTITGNF